MLEEFDIDQHRNENIKPRKKVRSLMSLYTVYIWQNNIKVDLTEKRFEVLDFFHIFWNMYRDTSVCFRIVKSASRWSLLRIGFHSTLSGVGQVTDYV